MAEFPAKLRLKPEVVKPTTATWCCIAAVVVLLFVFGTCIAYFRRWEHDGSRRSTILCNTPLELVIGALHANFCGTLLALSPQTSNAHNLFPPLLALSSSMMPPIQLASAQDNRTQQAFTGFCGWDVRNQFVTPPHDVRIPKIIWRTAADDGWRIHCRSAFDLTARTNPDWDQRVFTNTDMLKYIRSTYASVPAIVQVAEQIQLGVMLADLWRLLVLYDKGGLYLDIKCPAVKPIEQAVNLGTDKAYVCQWGCNNAPQSHLFHGGEFINGAILAPPRNAAIWAAVCRVVANLHSLRLHEDHEFMMLAERDPSLQKCRVLCTTGPIAFTSACLTVPDAFQLVSSNLNGAVRYTSPVPSEMPALRPDHYSKHTGRFLKPADPPQECVPRIVHISWTLRDAVPEKVWHNLAAFASNGFEIRFYSDNDCAEFMVGLDDAGKIGRLYASIEKGAHKADAFRYAILYKYGGVWLDIKTVLLHPLETFIDLTMPFTTVFTAQSKLIYEGILACAPKMAVMAQCLADSLTFGAEDQRGKDYASNLRFLTTLLTHQLSARHGTRDGAINMLRIGRNLGVRFDFDLCVEVVKEGKDGNKDRYGLDTNIFDADGRHVVKTRYNDFPWIV